MKKSRGLKVVGNIFAEMVFAVENGTSIDDIIKELVSGGIVGQSTFHMIVNTNNSLTVPFVKTTYPQEWISFYLLNNLMTVDPVVRHSQQAIDPFFWSDISLSHSEKQMMKHAQEHGLSTIGYTVPTADVGPYRGLFSICPHQEMGEKAWRDFVNLYQSDIQKIASALHAKSRNEIDPYDKYAANLSPREVECLRLVAAGKTHTDIAAVLGISDHTVRSYCRDLRLKLNCSTLAQAVAKACAVGIV